MTLDTIKKNEPLSANGRGFRFCGLRVATGPRTAERRTLCVANGRFADEIEGEEIELDGLLALPGLINAHDHLEFALFPRLGVEGGYRNARQWADAIYRPEESPIREHLRVSKRDRLLWGALRNLLGGVTTVCHHNPYEEDVFDDNFPVRVARVSWAHSLAFESDIEKRFAETPPDQPFVIHAAEGVDEEAREEIARLDHLGLLGGRTIVVHATSCGESELQLLQKRGSSIVWCPSSNLFLFGETWAPERLGKAENVCLGTDSPLTAAGGMLEELACARQLGAAPEDLYAMVTTRPACALRLPAGAGTLDPGAPADFLLLRDRGLPPCEALLDEPQIEAVFVGGQAKLHRGANLKADVQLDSDSVRVAGSLAGLVERTRALLGDDIRLGGKRFTGSA